MARPFAIVSGSAATMIADACSFRAFASAGEISFAVLIGNESTLIPRVCAASCVCFSSMTCCGFTGTHIRAAMCIVGITSRNISNRLAASVSLKVVNPVMFPVGEDRLLVKPSAMGSPLTAATIGILPVAFISASVVVDVVDAIASGAASINSVAA